MTAERSDAPKLPSVVLDIIQAGVQITSKPGFTEYYESPEDFAERCAMLAYTAGITEGNAAALRSCEMKIRLLKNAAPQGWNERGIADIGMLPGESAPTPNRHADLVERLRSATFMLRNSLGYFATAETVEEAADALERTGQRQEP